MLIRLILRFKFEDGHSWTDIVLVRGAILLDYSTNLMMNNILRCTLELQIVNQALVSNFIYLNTHKIFLKLMYCKSLKYNRKIGGTCMARACMCWKTNPQSGLSKESSFLPSSPTEKNPKSTKIWVVFDL